MAKALLISVGGKPEPLVLSIDEQNPEYVIYLASRASRHLIRETIMPNLKARPRDHEVITTPDEQNLLETAKAIMQELPRILDIWNLSYEDLVGDFTGGTKPMSAAVVLALSSHVREFTYVGGLERDRDGLGVVINGKEQMLVASNPWDDLAIDTLREMELLFNRYQFEPLENLAKETAKKAEHKAPFFKTLELVASAYGKWDTFHYKKGLTELRQAEGRMRDMASAAGHSSIRVFLKDVVQNREFLEKVVSQITFFIEKKKKAQSEENEQSDALVIDLVANAVRRAEVGRYDDAVARLYSAVEKVAKVRLLLGYRIDNSDLDLDHVPEQLKEKFREQCSYGTDGRIKLPLHKSFELLGALGDPLGERYEGLKDDLDKVLNIRNMSILAHGFDLIRDESFRKLLDICLAFVEKKEEDLPRFPKMDWQGLGYDG